MGQAFKGDLGSGNLILPDCCSCVHEPHSCWTERERETRGEKKGKKKGGGVEESVVRSVISCLVLY